MPTHTHLASSTLSTFGTTTVPGELSHLSNIADRSSSANPLEMELIRTATSDDPKSALEFSTSVIVSRALT